MKLSELRDVLRMGDVVGTRGPWLSPALITAWRQAGPYEALCRRRVATHICGVVGHGRIVEAVYPRVRECNVDAQRDDVIFVWRPENHALDATLKFIFAQVGKKYDTAAWAASYGIGKQSPQRWYCSELWAAAIAAGGYPIPPQWRIRCYPFDIQLHAESTPYIVYRSYKRWW